MSQASVVVLGGINMDLVTVSPRFPEPGETVVGERFLTYPGGKGANQAVAAARLGAMVTIVGRVAGDSFGRELLDHLRGDGADVSGVAVDAEASSGIAVINIDSSAQNRIIQVPGANGTCGPGEVERVVEALEDAAVLMLQLEVPLETSMAAAHEAASMGKTVILDPAPAWPLPAELYRCCGYITPNETEAQALVGFPVVDLAPVKRAATELLDRGAGCAIVKMGALGAFYAEGSTARHLPAHRVQAVDTVAAGDAFNGAVALAEGRDLDAAMAWAMAAGALAVTRSGAQDSMPGRDEVEAFLASQQRR